MKFDDLDKKMRTHETAMDYCIPPENYIIARLDGRSFTRLTKELNNLEVPFDAAFRDIMVEVTESLMHCGFRIIFAYTQSDEISLLLHRDDEMFHRKVRKINTTLSGQASGKISILLKQVATFDCRILQLPNIELIVDYFRWRSEDAFRNSLSSHCYWALRKSGKDRSEATEKISGLSAAEKNELLFQLGVNFNNLPTWQKRGIGFYWENIEKKALNPITGEECIANRKRVKKDYSLPLRDDFDILIHTLVSQSLNN